METKHVDSQSVERITSNILFLASQKGIKKSDLETKAGVTPGYLSRFKPGNSSLPSSSFLIEVARELGVTIDDLVYHDFSQDDPELLQPIKVVTKLLNETKKGSLKWFSILEAEIKESIFNNDEIYCDGFNLNFELLGGDPSEEDAFYKKNLLLRTDNWGSSALKDYSCWLKGTIYGAKLGSRITFMIIPLERVHRDSKVVDKALGFFINRYDFIEEQFTISQNYKGVLKDRLYELYRVIEQTKNNLSRSKDYDRLFDLYLEGKSLDTDRPVEAGEDERYHLQIS